MSPATSQVSYEEFELVLENLLKDGAAISAATVAGAMWTVEHQVEDEDLHAQEVAVRAEHLKGDAFSISLVSPGWNMGDAALNHP